MFFTCWKDLKRTGMRAEGTLCFVEWKLEIRAEIQFIYICTDW